MIKKVLPVAEFLLILLALIFFIFILPAVLKSESDSETEQLAFVTEDTITIIPEPPEISETSEPQTQTVEITTIKETETTEYIEYTEEITEIETVEIIEETQPPEETTEKPVISIIAGEVYEGNELDEFEGPEELAALHDLITQYSPGVSVFYKDLTDGEEYYYNPDEKYFIASLIKAPYAVYVYKCLLNGEGDLNEIYTYIESDYRTGTGKIKTMEFGTQFTLAELISYAIRDSDNVAMDKIRKAYPVSGFTEYAAEIGLPHIGDIRSAVNGRICARCAAVYVEAIYNFIEEENLYSETLKDHMLHTINRMIYANYPFARKYGWAADSFHDMGIVYNENRPYLITILSDRGDEKGDFPMFREISQAIERYNEGKPYIQEIEEVAIEIEEETEKPEEIEETIDFSET